MSVIDDCLSKLDEPQKPELEKIRNTIKQIVPEAEETISYGVPTLKHKGKYLIHFAAFKDHMSLFPGSGAIKVLEDKLSKFKLAKGTIQFTIDNPIPKSVLKLIIKYRLNNIAGKK
jgi:uncharacterized protein YdhG (YjbR/CyaY superfamily)